jgi:ABC-type glycerol-3-phosphate transport system substrate-binding protein
MKRNQLLCLALIVFTLISVSACGNKNSKIKVKIGMWPESQLTQDIAMYNEWKKRFEEDYPQYEIVPANYTYSVDTIHSKAQSNSLPTVFQTWFTEPQMLIKNGYIKDITAPLKELGWYEKMDAQMRDTLTVNDKIYGVPRDGYGLGLILNLETLEFNEILRDVDGDNKVDLYDEEGNPMYPTTFEEIYTMSQTINENTNGETKGLLILSSNKNGGWQFANMAWNFGANLEKQNNEGKWVGNLNDPKAVEALEWIQKLAQEDLLVNTVTLSYSDWYTNIVDRVAMAIVGSDVISLAVTNGGMDLDNIAYVPMPKGPYGDQYSLFGGTPYVFAKNASDEEVMGALRFLEYIGRSPEVSDVSILAMREGNETAVRKAMPILPTIKAWSDPTYLTTVEALETEYINVDMKYYNDFYNSIFDIRRSEELYYTQEMYTLLDTAIQAILTEPDTTSALSQLTTANSTFNNLYMSKLYK